MVRLTLSLLNLNRYLINFSYIGTNFSGVARQKIKQKTVSNVIEECIQYIQPICDLKSNFYVSSRTDAGVHALSNTGHFDLLINETYLKEKLKGYDKNDFDTTQVICSDIKSELNKIFINYDYAIRILNIQKVENDFISRHADSRTYFYRLGLLKNGRQIFNEFSDVKKVEKALNPRSNITMGHYFPINNFINSFEQQFITEISEQFDYDLFVKALKLFNGQHNFSAFTTASGRLEMQKMRRNPIKSVKIEVIKDKHQFLFDNVHNYDTKYKLIEVEITAGSFLYKMIRKTVGAAVGVARGLIPLKQIEDMMLCPPDFYHSNPTTVLQPNGLFLKNVHYKNKDNVK